jgi:hypothetical protein
MDVLVHGDALARVRICQQDATDEDKTHVSLYNIVLGECCFGLEDAMEHIIHPMQRSHVQVDAHTLSVARIFGIATVLSF